MKIKVSLDPTDYKIRAELDREKGAISNRLALSENHKYINHSVDELKKLAMDVGEYGHAFSAVNLEGKSRDDENFEQSYFFAVDFDSDKPDNQTTYKIEFARAEQYGLPILFAYETLRSENRSRFRFVFLMDGSINKPEIAKFIMQALITIFPNSDRACSNVLRMYFGGKKLIYFNKNISTIDAELIDIALCSALKDRHREHHKRELQRFARKTGLNFKDDMLDITVHDDLAELANSKSGRTLPTLLRYHREDDKKLPRFYELNFSDESNILAEDTGKPEQKQPYRFHKELRESDIPKLREKCQLFREFESGKSWLWHNELFGLATNIVQIDKGKALFLAVLLNVVKKNWRFWSYKKKHTYFQDYCFSYIEAKYSKPQNCSKFCPYADECDRAKDIVSTVKVKRKEIVKLVNWVINYAASTEEAEEDFKSHFQMAMSATDNRIYIIKAMTALGKTEVYLDYMLISLKPCIICVPANILKEDVYWRAVIKFGTEEIKKYPEFSDLTGDAYKEKVKELGLKVGKVMMTPSLKHIMERKENKKNPTLMEKWKVIEGLYESGLYWKVIPIIKKMIQEEDGGNPVLEQFLEDLERVRNFDGHIITTHSRFLHKPEHELKRYEIIIDEDVVKTVISDKVSIKTYNLAKKLRANKLNNPVVDKIIEAYEYSKQAVTKDIFFKLPKVELDEENAATSWGFDIAAFCEAEHFCYCLKERSIIFIKPVEFTKLKCTIVSATVNKTVCEYYFGKGRIHFHECKQALYKGELVQYGNNTMSRSLIRENLAIYSEIERELGKMNRITFKEFAGADKLYYGKTEGCDFLKGENLCVIGTPHFPSWVYVLIALTIGLEFDRNDDLQPQDVEHNGYKFNFMTYKDEVLRSIQFFLIEGELEQAVGRARLLRCENCTVYLFSNFPLSQISRLERFEFDCLKKSRAPKGKKYKS